MSTSDLPGSQKLSLFRPSGWVWLWQERFSGPGQLALLYLLALALAEAVTVFLEARLGMLLHGLLLFSVLVQAARSKNKQTYRFLVTLALAPLIRLLSLTMPLPSFPFVYWYFVVGGPLLVSAFLAARLVGLNLECLGLHWRGLPLQILVGLTGLGLGYIEYLILSPAPLAKELTLSAIWLPSLVLLIFTGLLEEIIFRGLLQQTAIRLLGRPGFYYVAAVFAILHLGYHSLADVLFVFGAALFFGWVVLRSGSIVGVTISHGLTNISLFLLFPLLLVEPPAPLPSLAPHTVLPATSASPSASPSPSDPILSGQALYLPLQPPPLPAHTNTATAMATTAPIESPTRTVMVAPSQTPTAVVTPSATASAASFPNRTSLSRSTLFETPTLTSIVTHQVQFSGWCSKY